MCMSVLANHRPVSLQTAFAKWFSYQCCTESIKVYRVIIFYQWTNLVLEKDFPQSVLFINLPTVYVSHETTKCMLVAFCVILSRSFNV